MPPTVANPPATRGDFACYYDEITRMDTPFGEAMAGLAARMLDDKTYAVLLSDNGSPMPRAKGSLYDAGSGHR